MLWAPWTASLPTLLFIAALLAWWFIEPKTAHLNLIVAVGCVLFYWAVAPDVAQATPAHVYSISVDIATFLRLDALVLYHTNMLVTGVAFLWLAHRAIQTLRKSVTELIGVLGIEVPDAPDVSLAGIRADAATLNWVHPLPARPVAKFLIQVNGVNVGESGNQETAITVTGLKPDHFYNIRVIAVGYNNFQAGSRVIRLRTFSRDGRPRLGNNRLPSNFVPEEQLAARPVDHVDEDGVPRSPAAGVEAASIPESLTTSTRDTTTNLLANRRNTLTRKHSPSTTSMDQSAKDTIGEYAEQSLKELGETFENIRKETEEVQAQILKDEKEHKELMDELTSEKKVKKRILKEKDDTTEKLKKELGSTERAMRNAQQRKTQKEKLLREKHAERQRLHDDIAKWEKDMVSMRKRQACFEEEREQCQKDGDTRAEELRQEISQLQASLAQEEAELKEKGKELKEAEEQRKKLPGGEESEEWRDRDREIKRNWEIRFRELQRRFYNANRKLRMVTDYEHVLKTQLAAAQQSGLPFMYNQANSSGVDFDLATQTQLNRRSRNSNSLSNVVIPSPAPSFTAVDRSLGPSTTFVSPRPSALPPGFAQGPYMDTSIPISNLSDEEGLKALIGDAPLSPTATSLLPAGMLDDLLDDDPPSPESFHPVRQETFGSGLSLDYDAQSPASSVRSPSLVSSPQNSSQHLPFSHHIGEPSDRRSLRNLRGDFGPSSSPIAPPAQTANRRSFLPWLHRAPKGDEEAPALGSLKSSQSQSLPRQTEDGDVASHKRRISFSTSWNMFNRNTMPPRAESGDNVTTASPRGLASRRMGLGNNPNISGSNIFSDRDPSSPRPLSIASSELPRPSTDSGSIWAPGLPQPSRLWPTDDVWMGSRNPSRRPSLHGDPSQLKTTLADADDEILDDDDLLHPPSQVGVIGTKPSKSLSQRLNPAAPTFMAGLFRGKTDKDARSDKDAKESKDKPKGKGKEKEKDQLKEARPRQSFTSVSDMGTPSLDDSPSDSRKSRDNYSVDSPSVAESRESLVLEPNMSQSPSDHGSGLGIKDQESGLRKLLRKGSSSKFSLSSVRGLSSKKGPNSVTSSDRNASGDRTSFDEFAEESGPLFLGRSYESVQNSPSIGPTSGPRSAKDKPVSWGARFSMKKKSGKEKESLDIERDDGGSTAPNTPSLS
ncbi:hypothetical protein F5Y16DRAFT_380308 [Xylariaceae sp. FL0255]|nr:hypothetical protein F5Y16DRAFT_380308 [Xylariaceae sp. FL0255]